MVEKQDKLHEQKKLESKILNTANEIFELAEEKSCNHSEDWNILKSKITDLIWKLAAINYGDNFFEEIDSIEFMKTICYCLENFNSSINIDFLRYLNKSIKNCIKKSKNIELDASINTGRTNTSRKNRSKIANLLKDIKGYGKNIESENSIKWIANQKNISIDKVKETIQIIKTNQQNLFIYDENIADYNFTPEKQLSNKLYKEELLKKLNRLCEDCEDVFLDCKDSKDGKRKKYLSALITRQIIHDIDIEKNLTKQDILSILKKYDFIDIAILHIYEKNLSENKNRPVPKQQDIASKYGKIKADASRTLNKFRKEFQLNNKHKHIHKNNHNYDPFPERVIIIKKD